MRAFVEKSTQFKPVILRVTIESAEELSLLRRLFGSDRTVPQKMYDNGGVASATEQVILSDLMRELYHAITQ